jgi:hypothetical protein
VAYEPVGIGWLLKDFKNNIYKFVKKFRRTNAIIGWLLKDFKNIFLGVKIQAHQRHHRSRAVVGGLRGTPGHPPRHPEHAPGQEVGLRTQGARPAAAQA